MSAIILIMVLFSIYYVHSENSIYAWDYKGYWVVWENIFKKMLYSPLYAMKDIRHSVAYDDYNVLPVFFVSMFNILPMHSRVSYIASLTGVYFGTFVILFRILFLNLRDKTDDINIVSIIAVILPSTFVAFWVPTLRGYPDIVGLVFISILLDYVLINDFCKKVNFTKLLMLAFLLWAPFLFRRWYAYTVVSLSLSLPIFNYIINNGVSFKLCKVKWLLFNFTICGILLSLFVISFQYGLVYRILNTNYTSIYSAYQLPINDSMLIVLKRIGIYLMPLFFFGLLSVFFNIGNKKRAFILFCVFNLMFSFWLFTRTQAPGMQHILPFALWIAIVSGWGGIWLIGFLPNAMFRMIVTLFFIAVCFFIQYISLYSNYINCDKFFPRKELPMVIDNYYSYLKLGDELKKLNGTFTIISSSGVLNEDMFDTITNGQLREKLKNTSQVDLRDGLNFNALMADYIVVVDPIQTHLRPEDQSVISIPALSLLENKNIGHSFIKVDSYRLSKNATAILFKKIAPFSINDIDEFMSIFYDRYPEWKNKYEKGFYLPFLSSKISLGNLWGRFDLDNASGAINAHPGEDTATSVRWLLKGVSKITAKSINLSCNADDRVIINISKENFPIYNAFINKGHEETIDVSDLNNNYVDIYVKKEKSSGCDSIILYAN